jgi:hypothetical protein
MDPDQPAHLRSLIRIHAVRLQYDKQDHQGKAAFNERSPYYK